MLPVLRVNLSRPIARRASAWSMANRSMVRSRSSSTGRIVRDGRRPFKTHPMRSSGPRRESQRTRRPGHGHARQVAIGPRAQRILRRYFNFEADRAAKPYVFRTFGRASKRESYSPLTYGREITRAAQRAGVPHWTPNQIRHTAATAIEATMGLDAARAALGHRTTAITKIYAAGDLTIAAKVAAARG